MPDHHDHVRAGAGRSRVPRSLLAVVIAATFAALSAWFVIAALQRPEPDGYLVHPPASAAPAVAAGAVSAQSPSAAPRGSIDGQAPASAQPPAAPAATVRPNADRVDAEWASRVAASTGIPVRALRGYAGAELAMAAEAPSCGVRWSTLAALGRIESAHGTHAGSVIDADGIARPGIFGIDLTGEASARITDTDGGAWDGKNDIDRAVGPMQFIPATWETWGADGNGDGTRDPQSIDDAALGAARYLCHYGDITQPETWRTAVFAYNHLDSYVDAIARAANEYAGLAAR